MLITLSKIEDIVEIDRKLSVFLGKVGIYGPKLYLNEVYTAISRVISKEGTNSIDSLEKSDRKIGRIIVDSASSRKSKKSVKFAMNYVIISAQNRSIIRPKFDCL